MSLNLLNSYEQQYTQSINNMRTLLKDPERLNVYLKAQ